MLVYLFHFHPSCGLWLKDRLQQGQQVCRISMRVAIDHKVQLCCHYFSHLKVIVELGAVQGYQLD